MTSSTCKQDGFESDVQTNTSEDSVVRMGRSGSMMSGLTIPSKLLGPSSTASVTFLLRARAIRLPWSVMLCIYLEVEPSKAKTWAIWQPSESRPAAGTHSRIWVLRHPHGQGIA